MTSVEDELALQLVKENYGELATSLAALLVKKKWYPFMLIAKDLNLDMKMTAHLLAILVDHQLVDYQLGAKQMVEYRLNVHKTLNIINYSRYLSLIASHENPMAVTIVGELVLHGYLEMSSLVLKLLSKSAPSATETLVEFRKAKEAFESLVSAGYVHRLPQLDENDDALFQSNGNGSSEADGKTVRIKPKVPKFVHHQTEMQKQLVPDIKMNETRILKAVKEDTNTATCKMRRDDEDFGDKSVYWRLNDRKFAQQFRDKAIVEAFANRIDQNASKIIDAILQFTNTQLVGDKAGPNDHISKPVTAIDIHKAMKKDHGMESSTVDKYLSVMVQDSFKVLQKIGDFSGGAYSLDFKKGLANLCTAHIESYINERYGSTSLRIFKVVLEKVQLEQKQIEDYSMVPAKDCKARLYEMFNDGLFKLTELSKASDHAPSRTFYLFNVDIYEIAKKLLQNAYKAMMNLMIRREHLTGENRRLLEKSKKVNAMIESLVAQSAEAAEIEDVRAMITPEETKQLDLVTSHCNKIEMAEIQLQEAIFVFDMYFYYHNTPPPPVQTKK